MGKIRRNTGRASKTLQIEKGIFRYIFLDELYAPIYGARFVGVGQPCAKIAYPVPSGFAFI